MSENTNKYPDSVVQAMKSVTAWRQASFVLTAIAAALAFALSYSATNVPTYIIPHELASAKGPLKVAPSGVVDATYLELVGISDLSLILTWTPQTVESQYARFLNRTTPELYAAQNVALQKEARDYSSRLNTQSFYPAKSVSVEVESKQVKVPGTLVRWLGEKESIRTSVVYHLSYKQVGGMLFIDDIRIQDEN